MDTRISRIRSQLAASLEAHGRSLRRCALATGVAVYSAMGVYASAAPLSISDIPLFLSTGVKPNLIMAIDDSGSMDFEMLLPGNDGSAWWKTAGNASDQCGAELVGSFVGCVSDGINDVLGPGRLNFNNDGNGSGTWKKFSYLFPNGSGTTSQDRRRLTDGTNDHFAVPPIGQFAWSRSPEHNAAYFDPTETYTPWPNGGGFTFADSDPVAARFDPVYGGYGTINLSRDFAGTGGVDVTADCTTATMPGVASNYYFRVYTGMTIPEGACIRRSATVTGEWTTNDWVLVRAGGCQVGVASGCPVNVNGTDGTRTLRNDSSVAIRYFPATVYLSDPASMPGFIAANAVPDGQAPNGSTLYRVEIKPENFSVSVPGAYDAAIQNFANWFSYYRKRHQALRAGLGKAFETITSMRITGFRINQSGSPNSPDVTMRDIDADRTGLYADFYQNWTGSGGTPNRAAVANVIRNFRRTGGSAPVIASCQRNFGMLFTDGFSNPPASGDALSAMTGNVDGNNGVPYADNVSNTMADIVMYGYETNIRGDLPAGKVQVAPACTSGSPDPKLDCNINPHVNFYAITLGARGLLFNPDAPADPYAATAPPGWLSAWPISWPTVFPARHPSAVDDLWHGTVNGRGQLLNAKRSTELAEKLSSVLRSITEEEGSAASAAVNSGTITTESKLFQAVYSSKTWTGDLRAYPINPDGTFGTPTSSTIPLPDDREIVAVNSNKDAVPFRWNSLDATRQGQLDQLDARGQERLNYLRGDQTQELPAANGFRKRSGLLGDIVNSAPVYVGVPGFRYRNSIAPQPYSGFVAANASRTPMVYAGANDGMLHGFEVVGDNVVERFAFVPGPVFRNLHHLTDPLYTHRFYADGRPTAIDAYVQGKWRTILVGGLNKGGQGIYALDVTKPDDLTESNADNVLRWEFTDANDADLGYTYSRPAIVKLQNGKWAAIFGNGYNNTDTAGGTDLYVSGTGNAALYIVDLESTSGSISVIRKIVVPRGTAQDPLGQGRPNGLATPAVIDLDGDNVADYVYAGDLFGNLWKFDLTSNNESDWKIAHGTAGSPQPLFVARDSNGEEQPITTRPQVDKGPGGIGTLVLFGTGKFLEPNDRISGALEPQSFYGIYDDNAGTAVARSDLQPQTILEEQSVTVGGEPRKVRITSDNAVDLATKRGWYLDLVSPSGFEGEMQVTDAVLRNGRIIFTTLIPDTDPCASGGRSWLMDLNARFGTRSELAPFDLNGDGQFNDDDKVTETSTDEEVAPSGLSGDSIYAGPNVTAGDGFDLISLSATGTPVPEGQRNNPGPGALGRQSWRQLR